MTDFQAVSHMADSHYEIEPLYASPSPATGARERRFRHKKRGTEYVLIGIGRMQAENWHDMSAKLAKDNLAAAIQAEPALKTLKAMTHDRLRMEVGR